MIHASDLLRTTEQLTEACTLLKCLHSKQSEMSIQFSSLLQLRTELTSSQFSGIILKFCLLLPEITLLPGDMHKLDPIRIDV